MLLEARNWDNGMQRELAFVSVTSSTENIRFSLVTAELRLVSASIASAFCDQNLNTEVYPLQSGLSSALCKQLLSPLPWHNNGPFNQEENWYGVKADF